MTGWRRPGGLVLAALLVAGAGLAGCTGGGDDERVSIAVTPGTALLDQPVRVSVSGLSGGARTTVLATAQDAAGVTWSASADFIATDAGTVSLDQAPTGGAYAGANPMGLFEFMTPGESHRGAFVQPVTGAYDVTLKAEVGGKTVATATAVRQTPAAAGLTSRILRVPTDGLYGTLFQPMDAATKKPALLVFGGSEGGLNPVVALKASLLAAHGYPTLALAYWKAPGLPQDLGAIPLEYFKKALTVLRAQTGVDPAHVLVTGGSWGGEGSLLVAATYPDLVNGVIAEAPNSYVDAAPFTGKRSSWTENGKELPFAPRIKFGAPAASVDPATYIPLDRIRGPIVLTCGGLDLLWPSCSNVDDIVRRLPGRQSLTVLRFPEAGHYVGALQPYAPITDEGLAGTGGSVNSAQAANVDVHAKILTLLATQ